MGEQVTPQEYSTAGNKRLNKVTSRIISHARYPGTTSFPFFSLLVSSPVKCPLMVSWVLMLPNAAAMLHVNIQIYELCL